MTPQATPAATNGVARLSIDDAARLLGISRPTVRRRLRSGVLKGSQVTTPHGRKWLVDVPTPHDSPSEESASPQGVNKVTTGGGAAPGAGAPAVNDLTTAREVELLQAHVDDLRRQLEDRTREVRELHTLLAQAQGRLMTDGQVSPHGESPAGDTVSPPPTQSAPPEGGAAGRRWWRRLGLGWG